MAGVYDLPGEEETVESGDQGYLQRVDEICGAIDQFIAYLQDYIDALKLYDVESFNYYKGEFDKMGSDYEAVKNKAYGAQAGIADEATLQNNINELMYIHDYAKDLHEHLKGIAEQAGVGVETPIGSASEEEMTSMVASQYPEEEVIEMEEAGPVRAWWDGLSDNTKLVIKAAMIGGAIWGGKKLLTYFYRKYQQMSMSAVEQEIEEETPDFSEISEVGE